MRWEEDPILEAEDLLGDLLTADLGWLDAHAHLGNFELRSRWPGALDRAGRHYQADIEIGGLGWGSRRPASLRQ